LQVAAEFPGISSDDDLQHLMTSCPSSLMYSWASPELVELMSGSNSSSPASSGDSTSVLGGSSKLTVKQELVLSNLVRVMAVISQHIAKQDEDRTTDFL
jgi:hypothetical protein